MNEEVVTSVRVPIQDIEQIIRSRHNLPKTMIDIRLETDALILYFADKEKEDSSVSSPHSPPVMTKTKRRKRRSRRRRNRMKTRGWDVVARIVNKKGQRCNIYEPFVEALSRPLSTDDQKAVVAKILRSNKNRPSETSIEYFLENTLEYLDSTKTGKH